MQPSKTEDAYQLPMWLNRLGENGVNGRFSLGAGGKGGFPSWLALRIKGLLEPTPQFREIASLTGR